MFTPQRIWPLFPTTCLPGSYHPCLLSFLRIGQATDLTLSCPRTLALATFLAGNLLWALHLAGSFLREAFREYIMVPALSETHSGRGQKPASLVLGTLLSVNLPSIRPSTQHFVLSKALGRGQRGGEGSFGNSQSCRLDTYNHIQRAALCSAK